MIYLKDDNNCMSLNLKQNLNEKKKVFSATQGFNLHSKPAQHSDKSSCQKEPLPLKIPGQDYSLQTFSML